MIGTTPKVENCLVSSACSSSSDDKRHSASSSSKSGQDSGSINISAVNVVDSENTIIDFELSFYNGPLIDGCYVNWIFSWADRVVPSTCEIEPQVIIITDSAHIHINGFSLPILQVSIYSGIPTVAVSNGPLQHPHAVLLFHRLNSLSQVFVFFAQLISIFFRG